MQFPCNFVHHRPSSITKSYVINSLLIAKQLLRHAIPLELNDEILPIILHLGFMLISQKQISLEGLKICTRPNAYTLTNFSLTIWRILSINCLIAPTQTDVSGSVFHLRSFCKVITIKQTKLETRNTMFTILANGGTPSGQICPNSTTELRIIKIINSVFLFVILLVELNYLLL